MLPKRERLSVRDIALLEKGRSVFGTNLSIRYSPASSLKFSVSVSKKIAKSAVSRNRIRRRVYAALRKARTSAEKSVFVMVMPKKECALVPIAIIESELSSLFKKAGIGA